MSSRLKPRLGEPGADAPTDHRLPHIIGRFSAFAAEPPVLSEGEGSL
jgi:hypothetical protein